MCYVTKQAGRLCGQVVRLASVIQNYHPAMDPDKRDFKSIYKTIRHSEIIRIMGLTMSTMNHSQ